MFKHYFHFSKHDPADPADHPGQPVHSDIGFDVWQKAGDFLLHPLKEGAEPLKFPTLQAAIDHARQSIAAQPKAAPPAPPAPPAAEIPGVPVTTTIAAPEQLKT